MPELVLLTFEKREFEGAHKAALRGDEAAVREFEHLWDDYADREIACFLCDSVTEHPPFSVTLPEPGDPNKIVAVPLCTTCRDLPRMVRLHRVMKMLRKLHHARTGKQAHYRATA